MKQIQISSVYARNFKPFSSLSFFFPQDPGLHFIGGSNQVDPRLGSNGSGKSSLWDAVIWCLYGTDARGHRTSDVIRWGQKRCEVFVSFDNLPTIKRTGPPNKVFVCEEGHDREVPQEEINQLVGLDKERFLQSVVFGQKVLLFLDLSIPDRGELLDSVLNLGLWLRLAELATAKVKHEESVRGEIKQSLSYVQGVLDSLSNEQELQTKEEEWDQAHEQEVTKAIEAVESAEKELADFTLKLTEAKRIYQSLVKKATEDALIEQVKNAIINIRVSLQSNQELLVGAQKNILFYEKNGVCPSCQQDIPESHAHERTSRFETIAADASRRIEELGKELLDKQEELLTRESQSRARAAEEKTLWSTVLTIEGNQRSAQRNFDICARTADQVISYKNPWSEQLQKLRDKRAQATKEKSKLTEDLFKVETEIAQYEYWKTGFKKVRLFLVRRVLATLELEVGSAASALGLPGWKVTFATETETKSGTMKQGVQIDVKLPHVNGKWTAPSPGEEQRVKLAISLGLANMIQRMSGVSYKFEVWDEPSSGLSVEGVADLVSSLKYRAVSLGKSVYLLDHRVIDSGEFDGTWLVVKNKEGSQIVKT